MIVGMLLRKPLKLPQQILFPVIRVKIQNHTTVFQYPQPLAVCLRRVGQGPGQIPGNNHVERAIGKIRMLRIHHFEICLHVPLVCNHFRLLYHSRCQINTGYLMAQLRQQHGEKAAAGSHIQNP